MSDKVNDIDALAQTAPARREVTRTLVSMEDFADNPAKAFELATNGEVVVFDEGSGLQKYLIKALNLPTPDEPET